MKSVIAHSQGSAKDSFRVEDRPTPTPGPGDVLVRVHASGVNPSDYKVRSGVQGPLPASEIIPHSDGAGVIEAVGDGVPASRVGERVWLYNVNRTEDGISQGVRGTAAEQIIVNTKYAAPLPGNTSFEAAACLGVPAMTAHRALMADGPINGQWILVTGGAGAVGLAAIALAEFFGAKVITTVSSDAKAKFAKEAGAHATINYREQDIAEAVLKITGGQKIDRIVDVALSDHMEGASAYLKQGGVIAHYATTDPAAPLAYRSLLINNTVVRFVFVYAINQAARDHAIKDINAALDAGHLSPIVHKTFAIDQIVDAHETAEAGGFTGNIVVTV